MNGTKALAAGAPTLRSITPRTFVVRVISSCRDVMTSPARTSRAGFTFALSNVLVKGADYRKDQVVGGDIVESRGGRIVLIDLVEGKSTTGTIARLAKPV